MNVKIIFTLLLPIIFWGFKTSVPLEESQPDQPFVVTVQHWFANPDTDSNFTERGLDLIIFIQDFDSSLTPEYVIFKERKSFPPMITPSGEHIYQIEVRIILESSLLQNSSERIYQTNRVVFFNDDGDELYIEFSKWETLPNRYD